MSEMKWQIEGNQFKTFVRFLAQFRYTLCLEDNGCQKDSFVDNYHRWSWIGKKNPLANLVTERQRASAGPTKKS